MVSLDFYDSSMPQQDLEAPGRPGPCFLSSFSHQFYRPLQLSPNLSLHSMMQPMYIYNVGSFYFWLLLQACFSAWNNLLSPKQSLVLCHLLTWLTPTPPLGLCLDVPFTAIFLITVHLPTSGWISTSDFLWYFIPFQLYYVSLSNF